MTDPMMDIVMLHIFSDLHNSYLDFNPKPPIKTFARRTKHRKSIFGQYLFESMGLF